MNTGNDIMGQPALTTTQISDRLGFTLSARFIEEELRIPPDERTKTANLWLVDKFHYICYQLSQHAYGVGQDFLDELCENET